MVYSYFAIIFSFMSEDAWVSYWFTQHASKFKVPPRVTIVYYLKIILPKTLRVSQLPWHARNKQLYHFITRNEKNWWQFHWLCKNTWPRLNNDVTSVYEARRFFADFKIIQIVLLFAVFSMIVRLNIKINYFPLICLRTVDCRLKTTVN